MRDKLVFLNPTARKEWDSFTTDQKSILLNHLSDNADKMQAKMTLDIIINFVMDLVERIEILEKRNENE